MTAELSPTHKAAHDYARHGWRVVPVKPGEKVPAVERWPEVATLDHDKINDWWSRWPTFGVGIVTGRLADGRWLFVVDVDTGLKQGDETLAELEAEHGQLPDTVEAHTGSGGRHLLYHSPVEIRNEQGRRLGPGIDIRGEGGFIVTAPTIHPNGNPYVWEVAHHPDDTAIADAPRWLIDLLTSEPVGTPRAERPPAPPYSGKPRPGDRFAAAVTWPELLTRDGANYERPGRDRWGNTYEYWSRPGVADHTGATLYYGGKDLLKVHSTNWPGLTGGETYNRFSYFVATRYAGDYTKAARDLAHQQSDSDVQTLVAHLKPGKAPTVAPTATNAVTSPAIELDATLTWARKPLDEWLDGTAIQTKPTWLARADSQHMLYPLLVNGLIGESGSGKSWVALTACVEALAADAAVVYIDLEDHPRSITHRLRVLGATEPQIRHSFHYVSPEIAAGEADLEAVDALIAEHGAAILVIDSVGEAMALQGMKQNDDDEVARWYRTFARRWAALGPAVILVDHIPKNTENSKLSPIGSQRKKAATDGVMYRVDQVKALAIGEHGILTLTTAKDRNGTYPNDQVAATCHFKSNADGSVMSYQIAMPEERTATGEVVRPTVLMERLSKALEHGPALTGNRLMEAVTGKAVAKRRALAILVEEAYVGTHSGPKNAVYHHSIKPYRDDTVPPDFGPESPSDSRSSPPVPTSSQEPVTTPRPSDSPDSPTPYAVGVGGGTADGRPTSESLDTAGTAQILDDLF